LYPFSDHRRSIRKTKGVYKNRDSKALSTNNRNKEGNFFMSNLNLSDKKEWMFPRHASGLSTKRRWLRAHTSQTGRWISCDSELKSKPCLGVRV